MEMKLYRSVLDFACRRLDFTPVRYCGRATAKFTVSDTVGVAGSSGWLRAPGGRRAEGEVHPPDHKVVTVVVLPAGREVEAGARGQGGGISYLLKCLVILIRDGVVFTDPAANSSHRLIHRQWWLIFPDRVKFRLRIKALYCGCQRGFGGEGFGGID